MELVSSQEPNDLHNFIDFLFGGLNGIAYVGLKNPEDSLDWRQHYFSYPEESSRMESVILEAANQWEVYLAPALYSEKDYRRETFKATNVLWTEFDGNAPDPSTWNNPPSIRIQSSVEGHEHCYWKLNSPIYNPDDLETLNRAIAYAKSADSSAWDATQILRPPGTHNHKRNTTVAVASYDDVSYDRAIFELLPAAPLPVQDNWEPNQLPNVTEVILKYSFPPDAARLFQTPRLEQGTRSSGLMQLAYFCCEMGMTNPEIFAVLLNADDRWKKFADRKDRSKRLAHIITVARHKYPDQQVDEEPFCYVFPFVTFINTEIEIDWVIGANKDGMLMEQGAMLMVGPSGIGKTQLSMRFGMQLAIGEDYLHYSIQKPRKILFLSLEMGHGELKKFAEDMAKTYNGSQLEALQENFIVVPHGEKWALNTPVGQEHLKRLLDDIEPDGIIIDSVGSALRGSINNDEHVQDLVDFNDRIRKQYEIFTWYIHHMRKSTNGGNSPSGQDDIYGNQYILNRATSAYGVLRAKDGHIKIRNFKNRLASTEEDYLIRRTNHLNFEKVNKIVDVALKEISHSKDEGDTGVGSGGFKL